ncbi:hypothetical protein GIB67_030066 [Kingdonia uniflora]|uniref:Uncharacterized protein n=1 Tax=Kingdonia uniflora TaxID=39325 RepID=A0A7J7MYP1_9MAGN|nr:hypothetical protein GIB67_030066 [Kingdonia uniflora]
MGSFYLLFKSFFLFTLISLESISAKTSTYIVHMDKSVMPKAFSSHHHWYSATLDSLNTVGQTTESARVGTVPKLLYTYENAINGFSVSLSSEDLQTLQKTPGFISAYPDRTVEVHTTHTTSFLSLNSVTGLWPASNYGKDVIIGVIDTGVWPESDSYKDDGMGEIPKRWQGKCESGVQFDSSMCNRKLIGARYFNKGLIAENPSINISMNSARDTDGHGTHTSSIAAGNYVEGHMDEGSSSSDVIAGLDQAITDGVDVISISIGFGRFTPFYEDPIAIAAFAAMEKGILVSASAGNRGPFVTTVSNSAPWQLTVGAGSIDRQCVATLTLGNGLTIIGWSLFPVDALIRDLPLVYNETLMACDSAELLSEFAKDAIVICGDDGSDWKNTYAQQERRIIDSTVAGAIFVLNKSHSLYQELNDFRSPEVMINPSDGAKVINYAKSTIEPKVSIKFQQTFLGTKPAPVVGAYSSRGPSLIHPGILKPDLIAPGTKVLAAWVSNKAASRIGHNIQLSSNYNMLYGTSMACPHASGVAALLKGVYPEWSPAAIRSAMMTTANPLDNTNNPIIDNEYLIPASPLGIGSGHIDPNRALDPGLIYDVGAKDYSNLLCSMDLTREQFLTITRSSSYNCSNPSSDLNCPSFIAFFNETSTTTTVQEFTRTATNVGSGAATYKANLIQPNGTRVTVSPKKLVFRKKFEKLSYTVRIQDKTRERGNIVEGSLTWIDSDEKHTVRSPIVVMEVLDD